MDPTSAQHDIPERWMPVVEEMSQLAAGGDLRYRDLFDTLASSTFVADIAIPRLASLCDVPTSGIARSRAANGTWVLYTDHNLTLAIGVMTELDDANVDTTITSTSLAVVGPGQLLVERYRTTVPEHETDVFRDDHLLEPLGVVALTAGISMHLEAERDVIRVAACDRPLPILSMNLHRSSARLCWHYDASTRRPLGYTYADPESSQTTFLLGVIADQRRLDHLGFVAAALTHPIHAVRWAGIKAMWVLDPGRALIATRACLADPHPHVRNAAAATLRLFDSQQHQQTGADTCR